MEKPFVDTIFWMYENPKELEYNDWKEQHKYLNSLIKRRKNEEKQKKTTHHEPNLRTLNDPISFRFRQPTVVYKDNYFPVSDFVSYRHRAETKVKQDEAPLTRTRNQKKQKVEPVHGGWNMSRKKKLRSRWW